MRILVCIPVMVNSHVFDECLKQIIGKPDVKIMILLNGANDDVRNYTKQYLNHPDVIIRTNDVNEYVTKAWNFFLEFFISDNDFDKIIILNSDLTLCNNWADIVREHGDKVIVPFVSDDKELLHHAHTRSNKTTPAPHPPGIFISLNKEQAKLVYPIPEKIKIWFNDTWIYRLLNATNQEAVCVNNLLAFHHTSTTVNQDWAFRIIQEDKAVWPEVLEELNAKIEGLCK